MYTTQGSRFFKERPLVDRDEIGAANILTLDTALLVTHLNSELNYASDLNHVDIGPLQTPNYISVPNEENHSN